MLIYGFLAGTAGVHILTTKEAKKIYTHITAAAMRGVDDVNRTVTRVKENCEDIAVDARAFNDEKAAKEADGVIVDTADEPCATADGEA